MATRADYAKLHFIVFLWGFSAILGKLAHVPTIELVFFRSIFAVAGMGFVIWMMKGEFKVSNVDLGKMLLIGFIVALHWLAFFGSARVANVSVSLVGFATNSLWTAMLEPIFNKTKFKKYELVLGLVVMMGLYIIFSFDFQYKLGLVFGILAGLTSAIFSILNSRLVKRIPSKTITFYEMIGVFIATAIGLVLFSSFTDEVKLTPTLMDLFYIAVLAGVCSVYAYTVAVELMKRVSVFMIQLTLNLEPVYGIIMAVIIFGENEKMDLNFYIGTAIIMCAVAAYPFLKSRFETPVLMD